MISFVLSQLKKDRGPDVFLDLSCKFLQKIELKTFILYLGLIAEHDGSAVEGIQSDIRIHSRKIRGVSTH